MECKFTPPPWSILYVLTDYDSYVWGDTVWKAKTQCESLDYLFQLAVKMMQLGLDPAGPIAPVEV